METVTVSSKYQVVIPHTIRRSLGIQPGQKVQVLRYGDRIEFVPLKPMRRMRGFLKGIDTSLERDADRL
jgi:AbrB family looped-hinge helix DNA binding protein